MRIAFSPPDITDSEIEAVAKVLRSGWITTGPLTKEFEAALARFVGTNRVACLSSATAALECALRALGVGPGDEVITPAYTYTATASVVYHVGATPVLVDTTAGSYEMNYDQLVQAITTKTKAIIPVDIAGKMCDYDRLFAACEERAALYQPREASLQQCFDRIVVLADAAHALGATYHGQAAGSVADLSVFSFHAVKNLTTVEGGALTWRAKKGIDDAELYKRIMMLSLHGQNKDALSKYTQGSWEYDIVEPAWKCNMTDLSAALGLAQLERYPKLLERRKELVSLYHDALAAVGFTDKLELLDHFPSNSTSSCHLLLTRLVGKDQDFRNEIIAKMSEKGIACNVHYKPLPLLSAYKARGFKIEDFPHALAQYSNELTLPLHTLLSDEDVYFVAISLREAYDECERSCV